MSEFDVIVVGGGPAGSSAAMKLASAGHNVLLVEKSDPPGSKNVSGGVLWGNDLAAVVPDWQKTAPVERYVKSKGVGFLTKDSNIGLEFRSNLFDANKGGNMVLRAKFDQWLVKKAKDFGAMVTTGVTVDRVVFDNGRAIGVEQDGDTITSECVILAEGANPRVAIDSGLREPLSDKDVAIGVKEVIKLSENTINERFNLRGKEGFAGEYVLGFLSGGVEAGGFLYTNKDTISAGVVISMKHLRENDSTYSFDIIEQFLQHPAIAPMLEGGSIEEYSAHMVQEGGLERIPKLYGNGYMITGDAAGFSFSNGLVLQGMNYAIASGLAAADTYIEAKANSGIDETSLSAYRKRLLDSYVLKDFYNFRGIGDVTWGKLPHRALPVALENMMKGLFIDQGIPKKHMYELMAESLSKTGIKTSEAVLEGYRMMRRM